jgi:hypothetical protein
MIFAKVLLILVISLAFFTGIAWQIVNNLSTQSSPTTTTNNRIVGNTDFIKTEPTTPPTIIPKATEPIDPTNYFYEIGKKVSSNSNVTVIKNNDGTIDVLNIIQNEPDVIIKSAFEANTRKWILEFMKEVYTSPHKVRYVQMSITWLYTEVSPTQVGLGVNQVKNVTLDEWNKTTPYDFCKWLEKVSTGKNDANPSNSTYSSNFKCS